MAPPATSLTALGKSCNKPTQRRWVPIKTIGLACVWGKTKVPNGSKIRHTMVMRLGAVGVALLASTFPAWADFEAGLKAYEAGEYAAAYQEWLPLARNGDPAAQRNVGQLDRLGRGVARDPAIAADWYQRAAKLGLGRAQANLAMLYLQGDGVEQDYALAGKWFKAAAVQGHVIAQFNLGIMYERGLGVERDKVKARAWYNLAAKAGHRRALDNLSRLVAADAVDELTKPERKARTVPARNAAAIFCVPLIPSSFLASTPGFPSTPTPPAAPPPEEAPHQ